MDIINKSPHYNTGEIECIDAIQECMTKEGYKGYLKGQVIKYMWRYESKADPANDLLKAKYYLLKLIGEVNREEAL